MNGPFALLRRRDFRPVGSADLQTYDGENAGCASLAPRNLRQSSQIFSHFRIVHWLPSLVVEEPHARKLIDRKAEPQEMLFSVEHDSRTLDNQIAWWERQRFEASASVRPIWDSSFLCGSNFDVRHTSCLVNTTAILRVNPEG